MAEAGKDKFVEDEKGLESLPGNPGSEKRVRDFGADLSKSEKAVRETMRQSATAMELPFTIVGAIVLAGFLGYMLDRWLHTWPWLTIVGGAVGFAASLIDIVRRYRPR